jgi:hypothetical protein
MKLLGDWNWYLPRWLAWLPTIGREASSHPGLPELEPSSHPGLPELEPEPPADSSSEPRTPVGV